MDLSPDQERVIFVANKRNFTQMDPAQRHDIPACAKPTRSAVVLCTYQGARFLEQQLNSIAAQNSPPAQIVISDDGSSDNTAQIIKRFQNRQKASHVQVLRGPQKGYATNFLYALGQVDPNVEFTALCDQDDVWSAGKLARAHEWLRPAGDRPALYGAATWECGPDLSLRQISRRGYVKPCFEHALTQNYAGGNTMVLNQAALHLVQTACKRDICVPIHDWWIYQLVCGANGLALFDNEPQAYYRQHTNNAIGSGRGAKAQLQRLRHLIRGNYALWNTANLNALETCADLLDQHHREALMQVIQTRQKHIIHRLMLMRRPGIFRLGLTGQISLALALAIKRY